jgi:FixJ family two-component response regulator
VERRVPNRECNERFGKNGERPTVYVVDPDAAVRDSLEKLFRGPELSVLLFCSAEEFLEHYNANEVGCLVIEIELPGISGLDLQAMLPERGIDLPVIVLSSQGNVATAVCALRAGAIDFLEKPFLPQVLLRRVREAVRRARHSPAATPALRRPS